MGTRREGREAAIQYLYQLDLNERQFSAAPDDFWSLRSASTKITPAPKLKAFAEQIVAGVAAHLEEIDARIKLYAANYELHRIAAVDRNILRVAIYEMLFCTDVPPVVSINEAIEIAKRFGSEESGRFVNGILDRVRAEIPRSPREASRPSEKA
jgi:transcription antitermination protein NusB